MDGGKVGCHNCGRQQRIMKRCTRCQSYFYCSSECQKQDWKKHKVYCNRVTSTTTHQTVAETQQTETANNMAAEAAKISQAESGKDIWSKESVGAGRQGRKPFTITWGGGNSSTASARPKYSSSFIDFEQAAEDLKSGAKPQTESDTDHNSNKNDDEHGEWYLNNNTVYYDVPQVDPSRETVKITLKANREKHSIELNTHWDGATIMKKLASESRIPLDAMKLIHRGKRVGEETVGACVGTRGAVFLALGERGEDEGGLEAGDIGVMMQQMSIGRNEAIRALRAEGGDLLDAIVKVAQK